MVVIRDRLVEGAKALNVYLLRTYQMFRVKVAENVEAWGVRYFVGKMRLLHSPLRFCA